MTHTATITETRKTYRDRFKKTIRNVFPSVEISVEEWECRIHHNFRFALNLFRYGRSTLLASGGGGGSLQGRAEAVQTIFLTKLNRVEHEECHRIRWLSWLTLIHPSNHASIVGNFWGCSVILEFWGITDWQFRSPELIGVFRY